LVSQIFYKWIHVFGKNTSKKMSIRKMWDHTIDIKKGFVPRNGKIYLLSREEKKSYVSGTVHTGRQKPMEFA